MKARAELFLFKPGRNVKQFRCDGCAPKYASCMHGPRIRISWVGCIANHHRERERTGHSRDAITKRCTSTKLCVISCAVGSRSGSFMRHGHFVHHDIAVGMLNHCTIEREGYADRLEHAWHTLSNGNGKEVQAAGLPGVWPEPSPILRTSSSVGRTTTGWPLSPTTRRTPHPHHSLKRCPSPGGPAWHVSGCPCRGTP